MSAKITLKKYPNRRLYDTENSSYVTLGDVAEMIRGGGQVEVIDKKTGQDVTAFILTQILLEQTKQNNKLLPVSLLHLIIRSGETVLNEFFENYLENAIESYLQYRKNMDEQFRICLELGVDFSTIAEKTISRFSPFNPFLANNNEKKEEKGEQSDK